MQIYKYASCTPSSMREIKTPDYTALISTPARLMSEEHRGYRGDCDFDGESFVSSFYGFFICRRPFIHIDTGLSICTNLSITDRTANVYVASHLLTGNFADDLALLEGDLARLEEVLSEMGSGIRDRQSGLAFGYDCENSQHKNIYEMLARLGYRPDWIYKGKSEEEILVIDHINNRRLSCLDPVPTEIPCEIDFSALVNGKILEV
jgi:hypothetical protein